MSRLATLSDRVSGNPQALVGDKVLLAAIGLSAGAAVPIGHVSFDLTPALVGALAMLLACLDGRPTVLDMGELNINTPRAQARHARPFPSTFFGFAPCRSSP